jgi:putative redox protein
MKFHLNRINTPFHFEIFNENGNRIETDTSAAGKEQKAFSPMELLIAGAAACSGIDVTDILSKQRLEVKDIKVEAEAFRQQGTTPALWEKLHLHFRIFGDIPSEKAERAVALSMEKYCSVVKTLAYFTQVSSSFEVLPV